MAAPSNGEAPPVRVGKARLSDPVMPDTLERRANNLTHMSSSPVVGRRVNMRSPRDDGTAPASPPSSTVYTSATTYSSVTASSALVSPRTGESAFSVTESSFSLHFGTLADVSENHPVTSPRARQHADTIYAPRFCAVYSYKPRAIGELEIEKGDPVIVVSQAGTMWSGMCKGEVGTFPPYVVTGEGVPEDVLLAASGSAEMEEERVEERVEENEERAENEEDVRRDSASHYAPMALQMVHAAAKSTRRVMADDEPCPRRPSTPRVKNDIQQNHLQKHLRSQRSIFLESLKEDGNAKRLRQHRLSAMLREDAIDIAEEMRKEVRQEAKEKQMMQTSNIPLPLLREVYGTQSILEMLFVKPGVEVPVLFVRALVNDARGKHKMKALEGILAFFEHLSPVHTLTLLRSVIAEEIQAAENPHTLFRGRSIANLMMGQYRNMLGRPYLHSVLRPILSHLAATKGSFELDVDQMDASEKMLSKLQQNAKRLADLLGVIVQAIEDSEAEFPLQFRLICRYLKEEASKSLPNHPNIGVVNFMFLRYICLGIAKPASVIARSELVFADDALQRRHNNRGLILASKVIQRVVNQRDQASVESWMEPMREWAGRESGRIMGVVDLWCSPPSENSELRDFATPTMMSSEEAMETLVGVMVEYRGPEVIESLGEFGGGNKIFHETVAMPENLLFVEIARYIAQDFTPQKLERVPRSAIMVAMFLMMLSHSKGVTQTIVSMASGLDADEQRLVGGSLVVLLAAMEHNPMPSTLLEFKPISVFDLISMAADDDWHFERNSLTVTMISKYSLLIAGKFREGALSKTVGDVVREDVCLEIEKGLGLTYSKKGNARRLADKCSSLVDQIWASLSLIPLDVWRVFHYIAMEKQIAVAPLVVAALICPALEDPIGYQLVSVKKVSSNARRTLSLMSTCMMHVATGRSFTGKGAAFDSLNQSIEWMSGSFAPRLQEWATTKHTGRNAAVQISKEDEEIAIARVFSFTATHLDELQERIPPAMREHRLSYKLHELYMTAAKIPVSHGRLKYLHVDSGGNGSSSSTA